MAEFDDDRIKRIVQLAEKAKKQSEIHWSAEAVYHRLDLAIIGNKRYKQSLAVCLSDFLGESPLRNHLLVAGPSGTGKTFLLEECIPDFKIPFVTIDASSLVPSGYKGSTLSELLKDFFRLNTTASRKCIIILDEFDKISEKANGGDIHKSSSIQSELLTLIQGKCENEIDTRNALWILAGAFAFTEEMKGNPPDLTKNALLKYGFKNELLGRITKITMTDIPTVEEVVRRVAHDKCIQSFSLALERLGYQIDFEDEAFLELSTAAQNPNFGMRIIPTIVTELKEHVVFNCQKGKVIIDVKMIKQALKR